MLMECYGADNYLVLPLCKILLFLRKVFLINLKIPLIKITAFNGSPRGKKSNTHRMVGEFLAGDEKAGAEVENIFLIKKKIKFCHGCFDCWTKTPGKCIFNDDMDELLKKFIESDVVVIATPVYVDNVSGIMKNFMDRLIPLVDPHFEHDESGETRHTKRFEKYPKIVIVSNCGFPEQSHFQVLELLVHRIARNMHSEVIAEIYQSVGEILSVKNIMLKPLINRYYKLLRKAGKEAVTEMKLSEETRAKLEKPIVPMEKYSQGANKRWDKLSEIKH